MASKKKAPKNMPRPKAPPMHQAKKPLPKMKGC